MNEENLNNIYNSLNKLNSIIEPYLQRIRDEFFLLMHHIIDFPIIIWLGIIIILITLELFLNKKINENITLYNKIDNIYGNDVIRGWVTLALISSIIYGLYSIDNYEINFYNIIICYLIWCFFSFFVNAINFLAIRRWKKEITLMLENASITFFEDYINKATEYSWKNKSAQKNHFLFLDKISNYYKKFNGIVIESYEWNSAKEYVGILVIFSSILISWYSGGGWWWILPLCSLIILQSRMDGKLIYPKISKWKSIALIMKACFASIVYPTIVFSIASIGGWYLYFSIFVAFIWIYKNINVDNKEIEKDSEIKNKSSNYDYKDITTFNIENINELISWTDNLNNICTKYTEDNYYLAELIPSIKFENAMKRYPVLGGGAVIALIDLTMLGSAYNGLLIGEKGISWNNSLDYKSEPIQMTWEYFSQQSITFNNNTIFFGSNILLNLSNYNFDKNSFLCFLKSIQESYIIYMHTNYSKEFVTPDLKKKDITISNTKISKNTEMKKNESNSSESSSNLGVWTFIAFIIAYNAGHWWWLLAIILGLAWLGSLNENTKNEEITLKVIKGWEKKLTHICKEYSGTNNYYVLDLIPSDKLKIAVRRYPTLCGDKIIALIDMTISGTSQSGIMIGVNGISWINVWGGTHNQMNWNDFSQQVLSKEDSIIHVGSTRTLNISECQFDKNIVFDLFKSIQEAYLLLQNQNSSKNNDLIDHTNKYKKNISENEFITPKSKIEPFVELRKDNTTENFDGIDEQLLFNKNIFKKTNELASDVKVVTLTSDMNSGSLVNINTADIDKLLSLPGIGIAEAKKLIIQREVNGDFISVDQVADFLKLKPHHVKQWRELVENIQNTNMHKSIIDDTHESKVNRPLGGRTID
jgi:DNA uptake protein ComE-like DNA-binding protein